MISICRHIIYAVFGPATDSHAKYTCLGLSGFVMY